VSESARLTLRPDAKSLALLGCGDMASEYLKALRFVGFPLNDVLLVCRNVAKGEALAGQHGTRYLALDKMDTLAPPSAAIISVSQHALPEVTRRAAEWGVKRLLIEKPGALSANELAILGDELDRLQIEGYIAFNRRFYGSTAHCRRTIAADGGAVACFFEATEVERLVMQERDTKNLPRIVLDRWGVANACHVIDLATHLAGIPSELDCRRAGALPWHSAGAVFAGSGAAATGTLFTYIATWGAAGRWRVEVTTRLRRLILCPLETVQVQEAGSFAIAQVSLPPEPNGVKPGLAAMLSEFLGLPAGPRQLPTLAETTYILQIAERIFGYSD
jgi:predicted dehydrogenase